MTDLQKLEFGNQQQGLWQMAEKRVPTKVQAHATVTRSHQANLNREAINILAARIDRVASSVGEKVWLA